MSHVLVAEEGLLYCLFNIIIVVLLKHFSLNCSVERLFHELVESGQDALYPVTLTQNGVLGLDPKIIGSFSMLFVLLKYYG